MQSWKSEILLDCEWHGDNIARGAITASSASAFHDAMPSGASLRTFSSHPYTLSFWESPIYIESVFNTLKRFNVEPDALLLDVGASDGRLTIPLLEAGFSRVIALDSDIRPLRRLEEEVLQRGFGNQILLIHSDFATAPLRLNSFDVVVALGVFYYMPGKLRESARRTFSLMRPEGIVIHSEPDLEGSFYKALALDGLEEALRVYATTSMLEEAPPGSSRYDTYARPTIIEVFEEEGLILEQSSPIPLLAQLIRILEVRGHISKHQLKQNESLIREALDFFAAFGCAAKHIIWQHRKACSQ